MQRRHKCEIATMKELFLLLPSDSVRNQWVA
jgi:hypothetical protein